MAVLVSIPISFCDLVVDYQQPDFGLFADRAPLVKELFNALADWGPLVDNLEVLNTGKLSEQGISLRLPTRSASFFLGPASSRFTQDNPNWTSAEETIDLIEALLHVLGSRSVEMSVKRAGLAMHIQPDDILIMDILSPLVSANLRTLDAEPLVTLASVLKWRDRRVMIDGSNAIANGIFIRLDRDFPSSVSSKEIVAQVREDQSELFKRLNIEEGFR